MVDAEKATAGEREVDTREVDGGRDTHANVADLNVEKELADVEIKITVRGQ